MSLEHLAGPESRDVLKEFGAQQKDKEPAYRDPIWNNLSLKIKIDSTDYNPQNIVRICGSVLL